MRHAFLPDGNLLDPGGLYVALGILGATVMPHNLFLHSAQVKTRLGEARKRVYRLLLLDTVLALSGAWLVNGAILVVAAAVFHQRGLVIATWPRPTTPWPLLGPWRPGLRGGPPGQRPFQHHHGHPCRPGGGGGVPKGEEPPGEAPLLTRLFAVLPASFALTLGASPMALIVLSQVVLSFQLPFALFPLVRLTEDPG